MAKVLVVEPAHPPLGALVLRFPPGGGDQIAKIRKEAKYVHRRRPEGRDSWYRLSVWVAERGPDETTEQVMTRLSIRLDSRTFRWTTRGTQCSGGQR